MLKAHQLSGEFPAINRIAIDFFYKPIPKTKKIEIKKT